MSDPHISPAVPVNQLVVRELQKEVALARAMQVETGESVSQYFDLIAFNPLEQAQKFKTLQDIHVGKDGKKAEESKEPDAIEDLEKIEEVAQKFQNNNDELNAKTLKILRSQLANSDSSDDVLAKVETIYQEAALADEALEFLSETTEAQLLAATLEAREKLRKDRNKEIRAGRNMGAQSREFAKEGLGTPTSLRELYRDITQNPREPLQLFHELTEKFPYSRLARAVTFLLHSLGSDLKAKGPSIQRGELKRLLDETRSVQGIMGLFRFFQSRMPLIRREFNSYELILPPKLDFELIGRLFGKLMAERFINPEKILQTARLLGISEEIAAQIVIYSQMRDALKQIAPKYFRDAKHREELLKAFTDTLDKLEDDLEEEEDG